VNFVHFVEGDVDKVHPFRSAAIQVAAGLLVIAGTLAASRVWEAVDLVRFALCWAGVLIALDGLARARRGSSPLARPADWIACGAASVVFWDLFELLDLRIRNWWYTGVSQDALSGAAFGAVCFATVLPAVRLGLAALSPPDELEFAAGPPPRAGALLLAGLGCLALALAFPSVAFPLAWLFLWPLCEAAAALLPRRDGLPTPLEARRDPRLIRRLLMLALPLGLTWESLNWGCQRGWIYTVPHFERPKVFEMPLAGYLGYLPFLLEAGAALALLDRLRPHLRGARGAAALAAILGLHFGADALTRHHTVVSFAPYDAQGVSPEVLALERKTHMGLPRALLVARRGWGALEDDPALVRVWMGKVR
jgi:hypothetical protein